MKIILLHQRQTNLKNNLTNYYFHPDYYGRNKILMLYFKYMCIIFIKGVIFIILDFIAGPLSLIFDIQYLVLNKYFPEIYLSDILRFC